MANTIADRVYRDKYRSQILDSALRGALVSEKILSIDRSNNLRIQNPYTSTPSIVVNNGLLGTYTPADFTTTDEALTVADEFIVAEHIMDFQQSLTNFDMFTARTEQMGFNVAAKIDNYAVNLLCEAGTGTYTTPAGGFATAANVNTIFANLISKVAGYSEAYYGNMFVVVENTDMVGIIAAGATNGFTFADSVLNNGKVGSFMGVDIHVVRSGTFSDVTAGTGVGSNNWSNTGHRVFGVKNVATLALPGGTKTEEKMVSGKTGMEIVTYGYMGFKLWNSKTSLIVDITLA